jgi:alpha-beta hydrolase superfamily lysophospholipase
MSDVSFTSLAGIAGTHLHGESLVPARSSAALLIVHGIGEHGGRYRAAMRDLGGHSVACFVYDQRGHGLSPGPRGDIERFALLVEDATAIARGVRQESPNLPLFLWGHSMGSLVATLAVAGLGEELSGVITSGCPIDAYGRLMRWSLPALQFLSRAMPGLRISGVFSASDLSHDMSVQRAYDEDPLVEHSATLRLMTGIATACREVGELAPTLKAPWLAVHGKDDCIAPPSGSERLIAVLGSKDKRLIQYAGLRHEVHNEVEPARTQVLETLAQWILEHRTH